MNDEGGNTNPCREIDLNLSSRTIHNVLYGVYGNCAQIMNDEDRILSYVLMGRYSNNSISTDEEKWYNWLHKRQLLIQSVRNLNKCGIEVDYSNRNEIVHEQK